MKRQGFLKGSAILVLMVIITKALGLLYKIPLTHILGGTGMGYYTAVFSIFTPIFSIVVSGIPSAMARMAAENYALERYSNLRKQKKVGFLIFGMASLIALLIMVILSGFFAEFVIKEKSTKYALMCIAPSVFFCSIMSVERGYYEGLRNMVPTAVSEVIETVFKLIFGLGLALLTMNYAIKSFEQTGKCFGILCKTVDEAVAAALPYISAAAILGTSLASGIACIYILISGKITGDGITENMLERDKITDSALHILQNLVKNATPIALGAVITTLTGMIDMITINPCIREAINTNDKPFEYFFNNGINYEDLPNFLYGSYMGLAILIFGLIPTLTAMFGKSILPSLADSWAKNDKNEFSKNLNNMMEISAAIAIPAGIGIFVLSEQILDLVFSGREAEIMAAAMSLKILGIAVIFTGIAQPCFTVLQTMGKARNSIIIIFVGGIIKLILNILLIKIPEINISGAAISEVVSSCFVCVATILDVYRLAGTKFHVINTYIKPLYAGIMCGVTAWLTCNLLANIKIICLGSKLITIISIICGGIMYIISLCLLCKTPKNMIKYVLPKKISKKA